MRTKRLIVTLISAAGICVTSLTTTAPAEAAMRSEATTVALTAVPMESTVSPVLTAMADDSMEGVKDSAYTGKYYLKGKYEAFRQCVLRRESNAHYFSTNRSGGYFGGYQFSAPLAVGASWMLVEEHRDILGDAQAKAVLAQLRATEMHKWPRYWQDAAFYTVLNWEGQLSGASKWAGGRFSCSP